MSRISKVQLKSIIGDANQSKAKVGFMAFVGLTSLKIKFNIVCSIHVIYRVANMLMNNGFFFFFFFFCMWGGEVAAEFIDDSPFQG